MDALTMAVETGDIEHVRKLVEEGANVNLCDLDGNSALHKAVLHPQVAHFLIQKGALVDAANREGRTPLHSAAWQRCLETVYMLLYYNADANVVDDYRNTPFALAQFKHDLEIQEVLFEYVDDFNGPCVLTSALKNNSPFARRMIERGADVNYVDEEGPRWADSVFNYCLKDMVSTEAFNLVWEKVYYESTAVDFRLLINCPVPSKLEAYVRVIIESDNIETAVDAFFGMVDKRFYWFVDHATNRLRLEQLTTLFCRVLQYGYRPTSYDVANVFSNYGFCELLRILLYMDVDCGTGWPPIPIPRMMFDPDYEVEESEILSHSEAILRRTENVEDSLTLLKCCTYPTLITALVDKYGEENKRDLPSLMEFSRDAARRYIWNKLRVKSSCQFYTTINNLKIPTTIRNILTFEKELYSIHV